MTEDEQKAEEYTKDIFENQKYTSYSCFDCKRLHEHNEQFGIGEQEVLRLIKQAYKDGYEQGQDEAKIICSQTNKRAKCSFFSENEKLTKLQKEIEELKWEQKQILEDNENYQKENEELKAQIEKMKRCSSCKHNYKDSCYIKLMNDIECHNKDKWELAE